MSLIAKDGQVFKSQCTKTISIVRGTCDINFENVLFSLGKKEIKNSFVRLFDILNLMPNYFLTD